ncbi:MAG TPA: hypothetical protein VFG76_04000 [Candidatus Polarisedimenticolia bacterium]|nr:hypothetical protein [Candidatus Polarisedimenticolia bacterium]
MRPFTRLSLATLGLILVTRVGAQEAQETPEPPPIRGDVEERIQVLEEPWKVGDVKTYSLIFDYAPFGRQTIRLDRVVVEGGEKILEFSQMLHLDLRALGQEGALYNFGNVRYARGKMFRHYGFNEMLKSWSGYSTYEPRGKMRERTVVLDRAGDAASLSVKTDSTQEPPRTLPSLGDLDTSVMVDLEIIGHWERLFLFDTWALGEEKQIPMMVPSEPTIYDYHLPVKEFRSITPSIKHVTLKVEALEDVSVFSVAIPAFKCVLPDIGYTIWVTARGGVIKFDNGRGLTGILER